MRGDFETAKRNGEREMKNEDSVGIAVWKMPSTISPCLLGTINIEICSDLDCRCKCPYSYRNNPNAKGVRIVSWECFKDCKKLIKKGKKDVNIHYK